MLGRGPIKAVSREIDIIISKKNIRNDRRRLRMARELQITGTEAGALRILKRAADEIK